MSNRETTDAQKEAIAALCQQHNARRLTWLYEPIRTGPDADSEAALLIEFKPADVPSLSKLAVIEDEIGRILNRNIDLHLYLREMYLGYGPREAGIVYDRAYYIDIPIPREKIAEFCKRKKILWLARFPYPSRASVIDYADIEFLAGLAPGAKFAWGALDGWKELDEILGCETAMDYAKELPPDLEVIYRDPAAFQSASTH